MPIAVDHVDFVVIPTRDMARAKRFYTETLGFPLETDGERWAEVGTGQVTLGLFAVELVGMTFTPSTNGIAVRVEDVAAARAALAADGVEFLGEPIDSGVCHMAPFRDPDGNTLILHQRYAARG